MATKFRFISRFFDNTDEVYRNFYETNNGISFFLPIRQKSFNNSSLAFLSFGFGMNFKPLDNKM